MTGTIWDEADDEDSSDGFDLDALPPAGQRLKGGLQKTRMLVCGESEMPLTSLEVSVLRAALETVYANAADYPPRLHRGRGGKPPPTVWTVRHAAQRLIVQLLVGTGRERDEPDVRAWRAKTLAAHKERR